MAAMHYNATMVAEDIHRHPRHSYALDDPGASPSSEEARSPAAGSPLGSANLDQDTPSSRLISYDDGNNPRVYRDDGRIETSKRYREDSSDERFCRDTGICGSPDRNNENLHDLSPGRQRNPPGKTSFCIDALLGRATAKPRSESESDVQGLETVTPRRGSASLGNPLHPFVPRQATGLSPSTNSRVIQAIRDSRLASYDNFPGNPAELTTGPVSRYDRRDDDNAEDDATTDVDVEEMRDDEREARRTSSASPGSNGSHSPASSPPISPGSEDLASNPLGHGSLQGMAGHPGHRADGLSCVGPYGLGTGGVNVAVAMRQNQQGLLLHSGGPLIHPSGLYYHPAGTTSAFHSIHKDGQLGHPRAGAGGAGSTVSQHPQQQPQQGPHHIHPLQLEWLARTGMLYPRLPADLAGESLFSFFFFFLLF